MAEELALEKGLADAGAVDGNKQVRGPRPGRVNGAGYEFLAGAALTLDQDGAVALRDGLHEAEDVAERLGHSHHEWTRQPAFTTVHTSHTPRVIRCETG